MSRVCKIFLIVVLTVVAFATVPALRRTLPGRVIRWYRGEPGATQWVNDTADTLSVSDSRREIEALADQLMLEYGSTASTLPEEPFAKGRLVPINRLPKKFQKIIGGYGKPSIVLRLDEASVPTAFILSWAHMRQAIIVFARPPQVPPHGFSTRKVSDRTYVVAN